MNEIYNNNPNLKGSGVQIEWTEEQAKEYENVWKILYIL